MSSFVGIPLYFFYFFFFLILTFSLIFMNKKIKINCIFDRYEKERCQRINEASSMLLLGN